MRRIAITTLILILFFTTLFPNIGHATPSVSAKNAVLIEESTGRILFEKNAHEKSSIASITKIMTAIVAIESGMLKEKATASNRAVYTEGSSIYLKEGEKMTIEDLLYGLMLRSGNDAAMAISEHVGGSMEGFVHLMNEKASWLGMSNTNFENPHGLDSDKHYSSAYDMALLMSYAMKDKEFQKITSAKSYKSEQRSYSWQNKNKLLTMYYKYCTGGKTGFTKKTGRTLVSTASKDGMNLIAVTLDAPDDWRDHMKMFDWGFENYEMESLIKQGQTTVETDSQTSLTGVIKEDRLYPLTNEEKELINKKILIQEQEQYENGDKIGLAIFSLDNNRILEVPIFMSSDEPTEKNFMDDFISIFKKIFRLG
ncbi:D-alanyl-D-alanine carboxypeptidase family protein [Ornithinibacillus halophilus]|uniref:serine-type D-Ala-D-Ala carboxypeptidase n=1 Tax=Ornithinibacillus halophilus TaxID=930117 RepID=A0A1M5CTB1_9BACI|nr:D-alanyl-D-alanine carboxypeptidase family protein [Ornithinibacillus halophilus]SHF57971.1 D-alanyl-D-alanine carboxypeptidase [Ornithinibacillus halophilus]